jgi:hypothetical protein
MSPRPEPKIHAGHMELAVTKLMDYRRHIIVPNVSWGWGLAYEADLIVVDANQKATEVEIKISRADLRADFKKSHSHDSKKISRLVYAVHDTVLELAIEMVPAHAGIIAVKWNGFRFAARWIRQVKHKKGHPGVTQDDVIKLLKLGVMRVWSLKEHNNKGGRR